MGLLPSQVMQEIFKEAKRMAGSPNYNPLPSLEQPCLYCGEPLKSGHRISEASQFMWCPNGTKVDLTVPPPAQPVRAKSVPAGPGPTAPALASQVTPLGVKRSPGFYDPSVLSPVAPRFRPAGTSGSSCPTCGHDQSDHLVFTPEHCRVCPGSRCTPKSQQQGPQPPVYLQGICPVCLHDWEAHEDWDGKVCYDCPGERCGAVTSQPEPELTPLSGVGINVTASPELDKFLVAMLRSSGGTLTIYPADAELLPGERLCVNRLDNPDRVIYELKSEEDDDERHVRNSDTG